MYSFSLNNLQGWIYRMPSLSLSLVKVYNLYGDIKLQDLPPEQAFADFVLCNLVIMNFMG